mmetsp:Transcript_13216/g.18173  ORF Transcript_13216/g.18173 Transcript_13216/m.18173 type:complete len:85 (+) Transcript_13216:638-892(+)
MCQYFGFFVVEVVAAAFFAEVAAAAIAGAAVVAVAAAAVIVVVAAQVVNVEALSELPLVYLQIGADRMLGFDSADFVKTVHFVE